MALRRRNLNFLEPKKTKIEPESIFEICSNKSFRNEISAFRARPRNEPTPRSVAKAMERRRP